MLLSLYTCCVRYLHVLLLFLSAGEEMDAEELLYNMDSQTTPLLSPQSPSPLGPLPPVTGKAGKPKKPKKAPQVVRITLCEVLCSMVLCEIGAGARESTVSVSELPMNIVSPQSAY